ncbi:MAG: protein kinase domain-containing protein [Actinomycetota bacterium]
MRPGTSMRRLRRSLFEGEEVLVVTRLHGSRLIGPLVVLAALVAGGAAATLWLASSGLPERFGPVALAAAGALVLLLAIRPGRRILGWRSHRFVVTNHRLLRLSGTVRSRTASVPLARITDVGLRRSLPGKLLGYGELRVLAGGRTQRMGPLPRPQAIHAAVLSALGPSAAHPSIAPAARPSDVLLAEERPVRPEPEPSSPTETPGRRGHVDEGFVFAGRYLLVGSIASGGMGTVYEGHDERLGRAVAIKVLREGAEGPESRERFRREARSVASLGHPNIASLFDYGEENGVPFMVMELVRGADLAQVLGAKGPLEPERAARISQQVLRALDHAHEAGVIHRDVKPANVILQRDDHVKVTDFGIARAAGQTTLTSAGVLVGSAPYISPEQVSGRRVLPQSDIYSTGILLYEMLTGAPPFRGASAFSVARMHLTEPVPPASRFNRSIPKALDRIVARATAKDPRERFPSADQMVAALTRWLEGYEGGPARTSSRRTLRLAESDEFDTPPLLG